MDVIDGRGPSPVLVLMLVRALPDDSLTAALMRGGHQYLGWGQTRHMIADLYDAVNLNTRATGNWGKNKAPKFDPFPRPSSKPKPKVTVRDIYRQFGGK